MGIASTILHDLGVSAQSAIREHALLTASPKLAEFTQESVAFQKKYQMSFGDFEKKIKPRKTEIFSEDEDALAWKFAEAGAARWREKIERLGQC